MKTKYVTNFTKSGESVSEASLLINKYTMENKKSKILEQILSYSRIFIYYMKVRTAPIYCFPIATLITVLLGSNGKIEPMVSISAVVASYFLGLATYVYNDLTDFEVDKINRKPKPTSIEKMTKNQLSIIVSMMFAISFLAAATINITFLCISISYSVLGFVYSHPKFKLKEKFLLKTLATAAGAGLLSLLGGIAVENVASPIIYTTISFFAFYFILSPLGDIGDIEGDRKVGRRTFPIVIGVKSTLLIMLSIPILILIMTSVSHNIMNMKPIGVYAIISNCILIIAFILYISKKTNDIYTIKSSRSKMRYLNILMQFSLLLAFL